MNALLALPILFVPRPLPAQETEPASVPAASASLKAASA